MLSGARVSIAEPAAQPSTLETKEDRSKTTSSGLRAVGVEGGEG